MSTIRASIIKPGRPRIQYRIAIALILAVSLWLISPSLTSAQNLADYFQLSYNPVTFDKNEIHGGGVFYATITGRATCTKTLPLPVSEASITSQVIARHTVSGATITLNSSYTIAIKPFPAKEGETAEINQSVSLQFPAQAQSGDYNIIGKIVEAKVKIGLGWVDVTGYLPQEQRMGVIKYAAPEALTAPQPPSPAPTPSPPPTPAPTLPPTPTPPPPEQTIAWWVWLIVTVAAITTVFNIAWFLQHRTR